MKEKLEKNSFAKKDNLKKINYYVKLFGDEGTQSNGTSACQANQQPKCKNSGCRNIG